MKEYIATLLMNKDRNSSLCIQRVYLFWTGIYSLMSANLESLNRIKYTIEVTLQ